MYRLSCTCELWGPSFSPKRATALTGLALVRTNEVGDAGTTGKYRGGLPIPYGSACIEVPSDISQNDAILWLANTLAPKMALLRECGAEDIYFSIGLFHDGQCNWSLNAEEFKAVAALNIYMNISAYADTREVEGLAAG